MSNGLFAVVLGGGAAMLALWVNARMPKLAPEELPRLLLHGGVALALTYFIPGSEGSIVFAFVILFAVVLPVLVYTFLVAIWVIRFFQSATAAFR